MAELKQLSTKDASKGVEITNPNTMHPWAKGFLLAHVPDDADYIVKLGDSNFAKEMYVFDVIQDVPKHFPHIVKEKITKWLISNDFENKDDDVCVISPFIQSFRAFIVEIFERDKAEAYVRSMLADVEDLQVIGLFSLTQNSNLSEIGQIKTTGDSKIDAKLRQLDNEDHATKQAAVSKANEINKRLW